MRISLPTFLVCFVLASIPSSAQGASVDTTVGDLLSGIAELRGLTANDPQQTVAALRQAGHVLPDLDPQKSLTEGDVAAVSRGLGINVTTSSPGSTFGRRELDKFLARFGGALRGEDTDYQASYEPPDGKDDGPANPNPPSGVDPRSKGKGKKKGISRSPSEPL